MYQLPTVFDFQRNLEMLIHSGEHQARAAAAHVKSNHAARGLRDSTTIITMAISRFDEIHQDIIRQAMQLIADFFSRNPELSPGILAGTARDRLNNFATFLLASVPPTSFVQDAQRFRSQYTHVFRQRLDGALRDIQIGFVGGRKIAAAAVVSVPATEPATATLSDALSLKLGFWGMSIDLVNAWKWLRRGLHSFGREQVMPQFPNTASILNRLWRDPVWSKVIATGITAGIGALVWYIHAQNPPPAATTPAPAIPAAPPAITNPVTPGMSRPIIDTPKVFTNKTIAELMGFYEGRTTLQGDAFMTDEVHKWINTDGIVHDIQPGESAISVVLNVGKYAVTCSFDAKLWKSKLSAFRGGDTMKIIGNIEPGQNGGSIYLQDCGLRE